MNKSLKSRKIIIPKGSTSPDEDIVINIPQNLTHHRTILAKRRSLEDDNNNILKNLSAPVCNFRTRPSPERQKLYDEFTRVSQKHGGDLNRTHADDESVSLDEQSGYYDSGIDDGEISSRRLQESRAFKPPYTSTPARARPPASRSPLRNYTAHVSAPNNLSSIGVLSPQGGADRSSDQFTRSYEDSGSMPSEVFAKLIRGDIGRYLKYSALSPPRLPADQSSYSSGSEPASPSQLAYMRGHASNYGHSGDANQSGSTKPDCCSGKSKGASRTSPAKPSCCRGGVDNGYGVNPSDAIFGEDPLNATHNVNANQGVANVTGVINPKNASYCVHSGAANVTHPTNANYTINVPQGQLEEMENGACPANFTYGAAPAKAFSPWIKQKYNPDLEFVPPHNSTMIQATDIPQQYPQRGNFTVVEPRVASMVEQDSSNIPATYTSSLIRSAPHVSVAHQLSSIGRENVGSDSYRSCPSNVTYNASQSCPANIQEEEDDDEEEEPEEDEEEGDEEDADEDEESGEGEAEEAEDQQLGKEASFHAHHSKPSCCSNATNSSHSRNLGAGKINATYNPGSRNISSHSSVSPKKHSHCRTAAKDFSLNSTNRAGAIGAICSASKEAHRSLNAPNLTCPANVSYGPNIIKLDLQADDVGTNTTSANVTYGVSPVDIDYDTGAANVTYEAGPNPENINYSAVTGKAFSPWIQRRYNPELEFVPPHTSTHIEQASATPDWSKYPRRGNFTIVEPRVTSMIEQDSSNIPATYTSSLMKSVPHVSVAQQLSSIRKESVPKTHKSGRQHSPARSCCSGAVDPGDAVFGEGPINATYNRSPTNTSCRSGVANVTYNGNAKDSSCRSGIRTVAPVGEDDGDAREYKDASLYEIESCETFLIDEIEARPAYLPDPNDSLTAQVLRGKIGIKIPSPRKCAGKVTFASKTSCSPSGCLGEQIDSDVVFEQGDENAGGDIQKLTVIAVNSEAAKKELLSDTPEFSSENAQDTLQDPQLEQELSAREALERSQLERDLKNWQNARDKLVLDSTRLTSP